MDTFHAVIEIETKSPLKKLTQTERKGLSNKIVIKKENQNKSHIVLEFLYDKFSYDFYLRLLVDTWLKQFYNF